MAVERGVVLEVTTAGGERVQMRALGAPKAGADFEVVWVATEREWIRAIDAGEDPDGLPWPLDALVEMP